MQQGCGGQGHISTIEITRKAVVYVVGAGKGVQRRQPRAVMQKGAASPREREAQGTQRDIRPQAQSLHALSLGMLLRS